MIQYLHEMFRERQKTEYKYALSTTVQPKDGKEEISLKKRTGDWSLGLFKANKLSIDDEVIPS